MKNLLILITCLIIQPFTFAQILTNLDEVSQFNDALVAVRKVNQWGFINKKGVLIIDFRNDLVLEKENNSQPKFENGRCLIRKIVDDIYLYGYIDNSGKEVITPKYLNATNFKDGYAIIIEISKETIGFNEVLKKDLTTSKLEEFVIDVNGEKVKYLENPRNYIPSKVSLNNPPKLHSKFIAPHLIAVIKKDKKWDIYEF